MERLTGTAAGVPFVAINARRSGKEGPEGVIIAYHLLDPPRTEEAFSAAVPLDGLNAWRVYLGLPMSGRRLPPGGPDELWRLIQEDAVLNVHRHVTLGALAEFPKAFAALRDRLRIDADAPVGVMGGSMGGAAAQLLIAEGGVDVKAAVLINPVVQLRASIDALSAMHGTSYRWTDESDAVAERVDFVRRAGELSGTAIRFITGADDMVEAIVEPVGRAVPALRSHEAIVDWNVVPEMGHALADEPGTDAAPQTPQAREVDRLATDWFRRHL